MVDKILCFEYLLYRMIDWYRELRPEEDYNSVIGDFSRLKSLKLLFFVSTVGLFDEKGLLDIFTRFCAMQHGPVESDIYDAMVSNKTEIFDFNDRKTILKKIEKREIIQIFQNNIDPQTLERLNAAILLLREENPDIVTYTPFHLVDISHKWKVWRNTFDFAIFIGRRSELMNMRDVLSKDDMYFK